MGVFSWNLKPEDFSKICRENSSFIKTQTRITGTSHEDVCTFIIISRCIFLGMRSVSGKSCRGYQNTHFIIRNCFSNSTPPPQMPHRPYGLRGPPSWSWQKCNRLLKLGRPWGAVTLSRWCEWWCLWFSAVMGKLFKEGAKGKEKNFRRANIIY